MSESLTQQLPLFTPESNWIAPDKFPNLSGAKQIAVDLETYDPTIKEYGPGWATGRGHIIGVALAAEEGQWYFPTRHHGGGNVDEQMVMDWLKGIMAYDCDKIFHNAAYDVGWLKSVGIEVKGRIIDTMIAGPLINENFYSYSLNNLARHYLQERKDERLLNQAAAEYGIDPKAEMYKLPPQFVGQYAEQDAAVTLRLWNRLKIELLNEDVESVFNLETELLPILIDMKWKGVRVDENKVERVEDNLIKREKEAMKKIKSLVGFDIEVWAARSVEKAFKELGLRYPRTNDNNPSFPKGFLERHDHELPRTINYIRELNKARTTFIQTIKDHTYKGRIHAEIHQLRDGVSGTVTGRFSYSKPNLQQFPTRSEVIGNTIRSLFLPEEGKKWGSFDFSQQEPRILVHYAYISELEGANDAVKMYKEQDTDFHQMMADMAGIDRKSAKTINLGIMYGMGQQKLADSLGLELDKAKELLVQYHERVPFLKRLYDKASARAGSDKSKGAISTLLGRKCRFHMWEPIKFGTFKALPFEEARAVHGPQIKRAFTYKALNRLIQGSAADMTKKAMIDVHKLGHLPMIQIHDELCISVNEEDIPSIKETMEKCVELEVPNKVDAEIGDSWGTVK